MQYKFKLGIDPTVILSSLRAAALQAGYQITPISELSLKVEGGMFGYTADIIKEANHTTLILNSKASPAVGLVMIVLLLFFIIPGILFIILHSMGQSRMTSTLKNAVEKNHQADLIK
ncbi:MAG: hypothetical protein L6Q54_03500 [Leptospiraceae bacterium]|nr:hypothetical protein [Turneriella sp.]MCK6380301.1 hypothetical protein [Leptospiraceae bacterium]